jgi:probable F420-dependent oxidoreductase
MPSFELPPARWRDELRRIEDLGFSSVSVSEHIAGGWAMDPVVVMTAAAEATTRLRILSLVLMNDLRHPALLHRAAASIDHLSEGRLELGLGAGWSAPDYRILGLPFDPTEVRIDRLEESLVVLDGLFAEGPVHHAGRHYHVDGLVGLPRPVQRPRPPILVGGGGRRVLELAAHRADIVGVHARLAGGRLGADSMTDFSVERIAEKVSWIQAASAAAGRPAGSVELQFSVYLCQVGGTANARRRVASTFAERLAVDPRLVAESPSVLQGSVDACVDLLVERRRRFGFSYLRLSDDVDAVAPIVARLSGR